MAEQLLRALMDEGLNEEEALDHLFIVDSQGLILSNPELELYKKKFAKTTAQHPWTADVDKVDIPSIIEKCGITVLIGTTGQDFFLSDKMIEQVKMNTDRPLILPLFHSISNPVSFCDNIRQWHKDGILVATGSPCSTMDALADSFQPSQCNNAFVFPGVGLGVLVSGAKEVLPEFFTAAAKVISSAVSSEDLEKGYLMPSIKDLERVGKKVALAVAMCAVEKGVSRECVYSDFQHNRDEARMRTMIEKIRWKPEYLPLTPL